MRVLTADEIKMVSGGDDGDDAFGGAGVDSNNAAGMAAAGISSIDAPGFSTAASDDPFGGPGISLAFDETGHSLANMAGTAFGMVVGGMPGLFAGTALSGFLNNNPQAQAALNAIAQGVGQGVMDQGGIANEGLGFQSNGGYNGNDSN